jgi:hypothetical protein
MVFDLQSTNLLLAPGRDSQSIETAELRTVSIVGYEPCPVIAFYQVGQLMQQDEHSCSSGIWREAAHVGNKRFGGKSLGPKESSLAVDIGPFEQSK